jgi:hypothetical protein
MRRKLFLVSKFLPRNIMMAIKVIVFPYVAA